MGDGSDARITKVLAYVVRGDAVCVFEQPAAPDAGIQVPAGTVQPGEDPADAVLREAVEETGLSGLAVVRHLGTADYDMSAFGRDEVHERHFFALRCDVRHPRGGRTSSGTPPGWGR